MKIVNLHEQRLTRDIRAIAAVHFKTAYLFLEKKTAVAYLLSDVVQGPIDYESLRDTAFARSIWMQYEYSKAPDPVAPFELEDWIVHEAVASFLRMLCDVHGGSDVLSREQRAAAMRCFAICIDANERSVAAGGGSYILPGESL